MDGFRQLKLCVFGFGNFDHYTANPSGQIAEYVNGLEIHGVKIYGKKIEVSWREGWEDLKGFLEKTQPDCILGLGLADTNYIRLEEFAINQANPYFDVRGDLPPTVPHIDTSLDLNHQYKSTLPLNWLFDKLVNKDSIEDLIEAPFKEFNMDVKKSKDAGRYLCNFSFYKVMQLFKSIVPYCGFIHISEYPKNDSGSIRKDDIYNSGIYLVHLLAYWLKREAFQNTDQVA